MNYKNEFPRFDDTLPTLEGFYDDSWHNDACPSLCKDLGNDRYLKIYIDYKDKERSDFFDVMDEFYFRFGVYLDKPMEEFNAELIFQSNDWAEIEQFIKELNK
jgi:hypothetical protein